MRSHRALCRVLARTLLPGAGDPPDPAVARSDRVSRLILQPPHDVLAVARRSDLRFRETPARPAARSDAAVAALVLARAAAAGDSGDRKRVQIRAAERELGRVLVRRQLCRGRPAAA